MARDYTKIKAYQFADDLVVLVYRFTKEFPTDEMYGLTSQLRRAAVSVAANIVEGASRQHKRDYLHFLYIARGSLAEAGYLLHVANRLDYIKENDYLTLQNNKEETAKTLFGLIKSVEKEAKITGKLIALMTSTFYLFGNKLIKGL